MCNILFFLHACRFPLPVVFRIYDNVLASGIESIFGFSLILLFKNEEALLKLNFDEILNFLKTQLLDCYIVGIKYMTRCTDKEKEPTEPTEDHPEEGRFLTDEFVRDAFQTRITPFMLDAYAREYEELLRARDAHATEMDTLRNQNRALTVQVCVQLHEISARC